MHKTGFLLITFGLAIAPSIYGRACNGNQNFSGLYGYVGQRAIFPFTTLTPATGTGTGTGTSTNTIVTSPAASTLITGSLSNLAFGVAGTVFADGNGGVFANSTSGVLTQIGTYSVDSSCGVTVTLRDIFTTPTVVGLGLTNNPATATLYGYLADGDYELDLQALTPATASGSGSGNANAAQSITGARITLRKAVQSGGCTNATLAGSYMVSALGTLVPAGTAANNFTNATGFNLFGRFVADGAGNLILDGPAAATRVPGGNITGTYRINSDCSGTATLNVPTANFSTNAANNENTTSGTGTGTGADATAPTSVSRSISFVVVQQPGAAFTYNPSTIPPALMYTFTGSNINGTGLALPQ